MKSALVFGGLIALLVAFQVASALTPTIIKRCVNSTQVQVLDLALLYGTAFRVATTPAKCYIGCIFETYGFVKNGVISDDIVTTSKNARETEKLTKLMDICSNPDIEGECEANYQALICWFKDGKVKSKQADPQ